MLQSLRVQTNQSINVAEAIAQVTKTIFLLDQVRKAHIMGSIVGSMLLYFLGLTLILDVYKPSAFLFNFQ